MTVRKFEASLLIPGDVIVEHDGSRILVLNCEPKQIDHRIRFTLQLPDGHRVHRTFPPHSPLWVDPLGAARLIQEDIYEVAHP